MNHCKLLVGYSLSMLICLSVSSGISPQLLAQENAPADKAKKTEQQKVITISKETTYLTEPLDDEGYVDYLKAINEKYSKGVTAETNYEVVVRSVMSPIEISDSLRIEYFKRIGMKFPSSETQYLQDFVQFSLIGTNVPEERRRIEIKYLDLRSEPWKKADHPRAAKWLETFNPQLDKLVEGSRRLHYYVPYLLNKPNPGRPAPPLITVLLPSVQQQRTITYSLSLRAMARLGEGDLEGAWSDLQAMHRIARHVSKGFSLIEALVGVAIDTIASQAEMQILSSPHLTDQELKQFQKDLNSLTPLPPIWEKLNEGERFSGLDAVTSLARYDNDQGFFKMLKLLDALSGIRNSVDQIPVSGYVNLQNGKQLVRPVAYQIRIDWNTTLKLMNDWYDQLVSATQETDFEKRKARLHQINEGIKKLASQAQNTNRLLASLLLRGGKTIGEKMGQLLVSLLLPAVSSASHAEHRGNAFMTVTRMAFNVELYRREKGSLPPTLQDLVPGYLQQIPKDPLSGKPLHYQTNEKRFRIYSVGRNGIDDQGRTRQERQLINGKLTDWDDIIVELTY